MASSGIKASESINAPTQVLMIDNDPDDCLEMAEALSVIEATNTIKFCHDGIEAMSFLNRSGKYRSLAGMAYPSLILLGLDMSTQDGRELLANIKNDEKLRSIPVVVFSTSQAPEDLNSSYDLGANSYIVKPASFSDLVATVRVLVDYWIGVVKLPSSRAF